MSQIISCEYTLWKKGDSAVGNIPRLSRKEQASLSFQKVNQLVLDPYCLSCHNKGQFPLTNYREVYSQLSGIYTTVFEKGSMPKNKTLPLPLRSLLLSWIEAGAPEVASVEPTEPTLPPPPLQPTYSSINSRIFNKYCSDCHDPQAKGCQEILSKTLEVDSSLNSKESKGHNKESCRLELGIYDQLLNGPEESAKEFVIPGDPDNSQLIISIERTDGKNQMPPPEQGYSPLSDEEKKVIREWITRGALNN